MDLSGLGEEWLIAKDGETLIAKFFNGALMTAQIELNDKEDTKIAA